MLENEQDVTTESSPVIPTPAEGQTQEQTVEATAIPAQGNEPVVEAQNNVEEVNWKNRAMEFERKHRETVENLPKIIQEAVSQIKPAEVKVEPQYSIADLRTFVETTDDVANKRWDYSEIERLESERIAKTFSEMTRREREQNEAVLYKKQVEQRVVSDPRFSDAFVSVNGNVQWNFESPLTKQAQSYMKDPSLQGRPDGMEIAMKLAYADLAGNTSGAMQKKIEGMKVENTKLKQSTLIEGAGVNKTVVKTSAGVTAMNQLAKTGSKSALRTVVLEHLKAQGVLPK